LITTFLPSTSRVVVEVFRAQAFFPGSELDVKRIVDEKRLQSIDQNLRHYPLSLTNHSRLSLPRRNICDIFAFRILLKQSYRDLANSLAAREKKTSKASVEVKKSSWQRIY
jgi:hypothetical protein